MGSYSFKSAGKTTTVTTTETPVVTPPPIGIKTPLRFGDTALFAVNTDMADQVADNFRNLLLTNWGERLGNFEMGANLRPLLANFTSLEDFDGEAMSRITAAVSRWMPYISLEDFTSSTNKVLQAQSPNLIPVTMRISYGIPALNVKKRIVEITMYAM